MRRIKKNSIYNAALSDTYCCISLLKQSFSGVVSIAQLVEAMDRAVIGRVVEFVQSSNPAQVINILNIFQHLPA